MNLMIDIEALGTGPKGAIVQIGAVPFTWDGEAQLNTFLEGINIQSSLEEGFEVDGSTIKWWLQQAASGTPMEWLKNTKPVRRVLYEFASYIKEIDPDSIWCHGFDANMLSAAYNMTLCGSIPRRKIQNISTLIYLSGVTREETKPLADRYPKTHDALDDCLYQIEYVTYCYKKLKEK